LRDFHLTSFTTGSGCIAPRLSMALLDALKHKRYDAAETLRGNFLPLEDARDSISPIRVLHDAVTLSGVADCGPMLPLLTGLTPDERARVAPVARDLLARERAHASSPLAA
jgi:dihydrodipicolinate synthase/N-acetylneuraminate lyase